MLPCRLQDSFFLSVLKTMQHILSYLLPNQSLNNFMVTFYMGQREVCPFSGHYSIISHIYIQWPEGLAMS